MMAHYITKIAVCVCLCLLLDNDLIAQDKPKAASPKTNQLEKLLTGTGLPFKQVDDSLATIPYSGENIEKYTVFVQSVADLVIIYTSLTDVLPGKIDSTKYGYLLQQSNHFDIIKLAADESNNVYVRADVYRSTLTTPLLSRLIRQVANVTNILGGELK